MYPVARLRITIQPYSGQKIAKALHYQKLLGALAPVKSRPHFIVAALVKPKCPIIVRDIELFTDSVKRPAVGPVKIKQSIIRIKQ